MKKISIVISALLCMVALAACGGSAEEEKVTTRFLGDLEKAAEYLGMQEDELIENGFVKDDTSFFDKTESTSFSANTNISQGGFFITYSWSTESKEDAISQAQEIVEEFNDNFGDPSCTVNDSEKSYYDKIVSSTLNSSGEIDLNMVYPFTSGGAHYDLEFNVRYYDDASYGDMYYMHVSLSYKI